MWGYNLGMASKEVIKEIVTLTTFNHISEFVIDNPELNPDDHWLPITVEPDESSNQFMFLTVRNPDGTLERFKVSYRVELVTER